MAEKAIPVNDLGSLPNLFEFYRNGQRTKWTYSGEKKDGKGGGSSRNKNQSTWYYTD